MELKGFDHIYECSPVGWFNPDGKLVVKLKCAPKPQTEAYGLEEVTFGAEEKIKRQREFVGKYVVAIEGLEVDGKPVTTFEEIFKNGPADLYDWIFFAVLSQRILSEAETKN